MVAKFEKLKLPSHGTMGGVSFAATDVLLAEQPRIILFGGQRQGISGQLWSFEQSSGEGWMQCIPPEGAPPGPAPRTQHTLTTIGDEPQSTLLLFGGFALNIGCVNDLWRCRIDIDPDAGMPAPSWEQLEPTGEPPAPRYGHSATVLNGATIVVVGGQDGTTQFNDVHLLGSEACAWSQPQVSGPPPSVRMKHTATACGGASSSSLVLFGGFNRADRALDDFHKLDVSADGASATWSPLAPEPPVGQKGIEPRAMHAAAPTSDGAFLFIHGGYDGTKPLNDLWLLDVHGMNIKPLSVETPAPEVSAPSRARAICHEARSGAIRRDQARSGAIRRDQAPSAMRRRDPTPRPATRARAASQARSRHTAHMVGDLLYLLGGYDGAKPIGGDVYQLDCSDPAALAEGGGEGGEKKKEEEKKDDDDE